MCFSATASFVTAAITGAAGITALSRINRREEILLAATPLIFATQQSLEGLLWMTLPIVPEGPGATSLTLAFLLVAKVCWPVFAPLTTMLIEPDMRRRRMMAACLAMGVATGIYFLWSILGHSVGSNIINGHIVYAGEPEPPLVIMIAYFTAVGLTAALSSFRTLRLFAIIVLSGSLISYFLYWEAFSSVWCFFAAAASAVIILHFEQVRQGVPVVVGR